MMTRPPLYHRKDIAEHFWEPGIIRGYRKPGLSIHDSFISILQIHNESLNIWTHLAALVFFIWYLYYTSLTCDLLSDPYQPLVCLFVTSLLCTAGSCFAHTFNSISELSQCIGFMVDYYGISLYAFGAAVSNLAYGFPEQWRGTLLERYFLVVSFLASFLAVYCSCKSRFRRFDAVCKAMRLVPFVFSYSISMSPLLYRVLTSYSTQDATLYYGRHFMTGVFTVVFYGLHIPELFFPGHFDIYFSSHQLFHISVSVGTYFKIVGLQLDISEHNPEPVLVHNSFWIVLGAMLVNGSLLTYLIHQIYHRHRSTTTTAVAGQGSDEGNNNVNDIYKNK